jgi:uncharacterized membrane protein
MFKTTDSQFKASLYFGIYTMVLCLFVPFIVHTGPLNRYNVAGVIIGSLIGGVFGGFILGRIIRLFHIAKSKN